jgi:hypothetical protein
MSFLFTQQVRRATQGTVGPGIQREPVPVPGLPLRVHRDVPAIKVSTSRSSSMPSTRGEPSNRTRCRHRLDLHSTDERQRDIADALGELAGRGAETEDNPGTRDGSRRSIGHATATEKCLVKINKKTGEKASDVLLRLCGAKRARTADPLLAKQVLFQLSYSPA